MKYVVVICFAFLVVFGLPHSLSAARPNMPPAPTLRPAPSGVYKLDKTHASVTFRVMHMGTSRYTARFTRIDATLDLDVKNPTASKVTATIDPKSIETDFPLPEPDFDAMLYGEKWLDAAQYPEIKFTSTQVTLTGPNTAKVAGDLTLHGVTLPVTFDATYNGGFASSHLEPTRSRAGFSIYGVVKRSQFGLKYALPPPGHRLGVADDVELLIEAEFTREHNGEAP